jgi:hypothetical protein
LVVVVLVFNKLNQESPQIQEPIVLYLHQPQQLLLAEVLVVVVIRVVSLLVVDLVVDLVVIHQVVQQVMAQELQDKDITEEMLD